MRGMFIALTAVLCVAGSADSNEKRADGRNLVVNGSFEAGPTIPGDGGPLNPDSGYLPLNPGSTAIPGWVVTRGQIDLTGSHWRAAHGRRSIDLNGTPGIGGIKQTLRTVKGRRYELTFQFSGHPNTIEAEEKVKTLGVSVGNLTATFKFDTKGYSRADMGWRTERVEFTATDSRTVLEFYSLSTRDRYGGPAIDDVRVVEIEP